MTPGSDIVLFSKYFTPGLECPDAECPREMPGVGEDCHSLDKSCKYNKKICCGNEHWLSVTTCRQSGWNLVEVPCKIIIRSTLHVHHHFKGSSCSHNVCPELPPHIGSECGEVGMKCKYNKETCCGAEIWTNIATCNQHNQWTLMSIDHDCALGRSCRKGKKVGLRRRKMKKMPVHINPHE